MRGKPAEPARRHGGAGVYKVNMEHLDKTERKRRRMAISNEILPCPVVAGALQPAARVCLHR